MSKESLAPVEPTYSDAVQALTHLAPHSMLDAGDYAFPEWDKSTVRRFAISEQVALAAKMDQEVRLAVQGNTEMGVAVILKPKNIFSRARYGFFIQPEQDDTFSVWHGTAKPDSQLSWIGAQSLEFDQAVEADATLASALVHDLVSNTGEQNLSD